MDWLPCPHGCMPEGGWLDNKAAIRLLLQAGELGGTGEPLDPRAYERLNDPDEVAALVAYLRGKPNCDASRARAYGTVVPVAITSRAPREGAG